MRSSRRFFVFGGGAAIDYGRAAQIHTKLNAAADAAALAALTPSMLQQSSSVAQAAAVSMFNGLTEGIPGLTAARDEGDGHRHRRRHRAHAQCRSQLLELGRHHLRPSARQERVAGFGLLGGERPGAAQYRLLRPARQFTVDGSASDDGRHHKNAKPDDAGRDRRLRLRLPSRVHQRKLRYKRQPLRRRDDADLERSPAVDVEGQLLLHDRSTADRSTTTSSPATTASPFVWTS